MKNYQSLSDFSGYELIVQTMIHQGYECVNMDFFNPELSHLLLRHDVDMNLSAAVKMAQIESKNNWQSIYFVMLSTEFYNLFSRAGRESLFEIIEQGHDIGLHYDLSVYSSHTNIEKEISDECKILESLINRQINYVAPHRPSSYCKEILNNKNTIASRAHPYQPKYFSNNRYIAESSGYWSHGHPLDNENYKSKKGIQLLTHPHLWINNQIERDSKLKTSIEQHHDLLISEAELNFKGYKHHN